jgi:hypothetical protein
MVTPLQIDSFTRDQWQEFDALAIARLAPLAYDDCYQPRIYVGLDSISQTVPALSQVQYGMHVQPGSLIYCVYMGSGFSATPNWSIQVTDENMGLTFFSDPVAAAFLGNFKGSNYPSLFRAPRPVIGEGLFTVEVWNQLSTAQTIVPLFGVLEVK